MIIRCERHGLSLGNFVCKHVQAAIGAWSPVWSGTEPPTTQDLTRRIDHKDHSFVQAIFVCEACMERFGLDQLGPVPDDLLCEEIIEGRSPLFPSVFPTCKGCLKAWLPARLTGDRTPASR